MNESASTTSFHCEGQTTLSTRTHFSYSNCFGWDASGDRHPACMTIVTPAFVSAWLLGCGLKGHAQSWDYFARHPPVIAITQTCVYFGAELNFHFAPFSQYFGNSKINLLSAILAFKPAPVITCAALHGNCVAFSVMRRGNYVHENRPLRNPKRAVKIRDGRGLQGERLGNQPNGRFKSDSTLRFWRTSRGAAEVPAGRGRGQQGLEPFQPDSGLQRGGNRWPILRRHGVHPGQQHRYHAGAQRRIFHLGPAR